MLKNQYKLNSYKISNINNYTNFTLKFTLIYIINTYIFKNRLLNKKSDGSYKSDFKIVVTGWNGFKDSYYKDGSWKSGNTEKFYDAILAGADNIDDIKSNARNAAAYISIKALLKKYIGPGALIPGYEELRAALDALGLGFSTEEVVRNSIAYCINLGQCQYYLNRL